MIFPAWEGPLRGGHGKRHPIILQQSVTMLAYMDKNNGSAEKTPTSFWDSMGAAHSRDLPILVGAATGAIGLIVIILTAVLIWHCCTRNNSNDKAYVVENLSRSSSVSRPAASNMVQSDSVIFLSTRSRRPTGSRLDDASPSTEAADTMSQLHSVHVSHRGGVSASDLIAGMSFAREKGWHYTEHTMFTQKWGELSTDKPFLRVHFSAQQSLYNPYGSSELTLKTRSLPSWGRSKQRPLSTEDDIGELYAKVNFSKRRKNRMRNDSAAAIAATRSHHQQRYLTPFHTLPSAHNDTDSLVDNEAVVVYDERTAV
ncbi:unnamed protein product [Ixodes hexagonus]